MSYSQGSSTNKSVGFFADHPFLFVVTNTRLSLTILIGRFANPEPEVGHGSIKKGSVDNLQVKMVANSSSSNNTNISKNINSNNEKTKLT